MAPVERWGPYAALAGGLVLSGAAAWWQHTDNTRDLARALQSEAVLTADRSVAQLERAVLGLRGVRGYLLGAGVDEATAEGFRRYMATRTLDVEFPGVMGHGFIRRVAPQQEAAYVARMRQLVAPDFTVRMLKPHDGERRVIQLIEPLAPNRAARGLDVASELMRRQASEQALQSDAPVLTGPIRLVQSGPGSSMGMLMLLAMPGPTGSDAAAGYGVVQGPAGYAYAPIQLDDLLAAAQLRSDLVQLRLSDVTDPATAQDFQLPRAGMAASAAAPVTVVERRVMGRAWRFEVGATPALAGSLRQVSPAAVGLAGAALSALLAALARLWFLLRRRTVEALAERIRLRTLLDNASDAIVGMDLEGRVILWNQAACRLFGYSVAEAAGRSMRELTLDDDHMQEDATWIREAKAGRTTAPVETVRRHRDGTPVEVEISTGPIYDDAGRVVGVAKVLRPVRERLQQLRQLRAYGEELQQQVALRTLAVEASRRDLREVLDAMPSMVGSWDTQLRNRFANATYARYFGHGPDEISRMTMPELLGPELFALNEPFVRRALAGEEQQFERDLVLSNGAGLRHTLAHYLPFRQDGEVAGFYVLVHDITAVKQAQQRLAASEAMLARTEVLARVGGWELDIATQSLRWSEGTCRIHARPPGYQPTLDEAIAYYAEADRQVIEQAVAHSMATGEPWDLEQQLVRADGQRIWVRARGSAELLDGRPVRLSGSIQDITEQVQARQEIERGRNLLQAAIDTVDEAFVLYGPDDRLVLCNDKYRSLYALSADLIVPGTRFEDILREGARRGQYEAARGREEAWVQERMANHRQASFSMLQELPNGRVLRIAERRLPDGHTVGFRFDVSELVQARRDAESASKAKTEFLATTSHEIRTPLNAIIGLSYLLERETLPPEPLMQVRRIAQAARSLLGIVNDVLDLSKIEAGQLELDERTFDLMALVQGELGVHAGTAGQKHLDLSLTAAPDLPPFVRGDVGRLRQILTNLIGNAIKFTDRGAVRVAVRRGAHESMIEFEVSDTGIGIDPAVQERLFQPFRQADASTSRRFGGTGLGLSIVAQLARLMGGSVSLQSSPGDGSRFTVSLSLPAADEADAGAVVSAGGEDATAIQVLLAEDDAAQRTGMAAMMKSLGWHCVGVPGGEALVAEARRAAARHLPFDVLLVDWQMPDLDGLSALERLREQLPSAEWPAVLLVTQHELEPIRSDPRAELASNLLAKPIDPSTLFNAVGASLAAKPTRMNRLLHASLGHTDDLVWLSGLRVLVVDDSELNLEVARKVLEREAAVVVTCESGQAALDGLAHSKTGFDAVLLDVQMPGMDGVEVARRMRGIDGAARLPLIALTAGVLREERERALAAGMNDFLPKPLDPRRLIACIRAHVERHTGRAIPVQLRRRPDAQAPAADRAVELGVTGIDESAITPALRKDRSLVLSMIRRTLNEFGNVANEPIQTLPNRMHKLRGSAQVFGATALARAAAAVESACHGGSADAVRLRTAELGECLRQLSVGARAALEAEDRRLASDHDELVRQSAAAQPVSAAEMDELRGLVTSQSAKARVRATALAPSLMVVLGAERLQQLLSALQEFDFQRAASALKLDKPD